MIRNIGGELAKASGKSLAKALPTFMPNSFFGRGQQMADNGYNSAIMNEQLEPMTATYWEEAATTRWGRYLSQIEERGIRQAAFLAGKPNQALEIGCDGGRWSRLLADVGWQMTCIDVNPKTLAACQQKVPAAKCVL